MAKIRIDRQSRLMYLLVPDVKFYTREVKVDPAVAAGLEDFYEKQAEVEAFLKAKFLAVEGHAPEPEVPEFLKPKKKKTNGKTQSKQQQVSDEESSES